MSTSLGKRIVHGLVVARPKWGKGPCNRCEYGRPPTRLAQGSLPLWTIEQFPVPPIAMQSMRREEKQAGRCKHGEREVPTSLQPTGTHTYPNVQIIGLFGANPSCGDPPSFALITANARVASGSEILGSELYHGSLGVGDGLERTGEGPPRANPPRRSDSKSMAALTDNATAWVRGTPLGVGT